MQYIRATWVLSVLSVVVVAVACSGEAEHPPAIAPPNHSQHPYGASSGSGDDASGAPSTPASGGADGMDGSGGTQGSVEVTFAQACTDACTLEAGCGYVLAAHCPEACTHLDQIYSDDCKPAMIEEFACKKEFTCPDYEAFEEDPSAHEGCGEAYQAKVAACGVSETTPEECAAYCLTAEGCQPSVIKNGCADDCNVKLGTMANAADPSCSEGGLAFYACMANLDCGSLDPWISDTGPPSGCDAEFSAVSGCL